ncbi:Uncharacterized protein TCM_018501 [Theobroma cacao]|uniref:Uncharacterized protein n=1 Tax=Theobroma cacao TaxID=3641 RepID=A0A061EEK8_THECC|nr:Uncharacterized protein TCM_018501 [Theobroma cacao]
MWCYRDCSTTLAKNLKGSFCVLVRVSSWQLLDEQKSTKDAVETVDLSGVDSGNSSLATWISSGAKRALVQIEIELQSMKREQMKWR